MNRRRWLRMRKVKEAILWLCLFYIIYVFMYGIVVKMTISNSVLFTLKTYIPELFLTSVSVLALRCSGKKLQYDSAFLLFWSLIIFLFNFIIHGPSETMFYLIRDIYIPMVAFCLLKSVLFDEEDIKKFQARLITFSKFYLVSGLVLCVIEQLNGWEWTSAFYTGYSFYGQDPVSKVKIAHNIGMLRAPSWSGNFATFGFYCLISYALITSIQESKIKSFFWINITFACLVLCTNKTALVGLAIVLLLRYTVNFRKTSFRKNGAIIAFAVVTVGLSGVFLLSDNNASGTSFFTGFFMRFDVWADIFDEVSWVELLFPYKQFLYGSGTQGGAGFWDNTYFYSLFTQGIIGTMLWIWTIKGTMRRQLKNEFNGCSRSYLQTLTITLCSVAVTANVTQGRGFISEYLVLLGIGAASTSRGGYTD